jgi:hypothetical protein
MKYNMCCAIGVFSKGRALFELNPYSFQALDFYLMYKQVKDA